MKAVLLSVQPKWCLEISELRKLFEVRKNEPFGVSCPFKVYIYCTKDKKNILWNSTALMKPYRYIDDRSHNGSDRSMNGMVIGEFVCDYIRTIYPVYVAINGLVRYSGLSGKLFEQTRLTQKQLCDYGKGEYLCCWHISDLQIYEKPKDITDFQFPCEPKNPDSCDGCKHYIESMCRATIKRAPQSWCYVEEIYDEP